LSAQNALIVVPHRDQRDYNRLIPIESSERPEERDQIHTNPHDDQQKRE